MMPNRFALASSGLLLAALAGCLVSGDPLQSASHETEGDPAKSDGGGTDESDGDGRAPGEDGTPDDGHGDDAPDAGEPAEDEAAEDEDLEAGAALLAPGTYMFGSAVTTSRCMDVAGGNSADRTNIRQWTCNFSPAQKYRVEPFGSGVRLVNVGSNKCVDVDDNRLEDLTNVQLYTCNGTGAQTFSTVGVPGGVQIIHVASGLCVGVADGSPEQGTNVRIRTCGPGAAQTWVPRDASGPVRIMPLGASITQGSGGTRAGYRGPLSALLDQAGVVHRFVGSATDNPGPLPSDKIHHEGHPGWVIGDGNGESGLRIHIDAWLGQNGADPDVVLLLVGSNDVAFGIDLPRAGARLDDLIGRIRTLKPRALIYVSSVPRVDSQATATEQYNAQVATVVSVREARGEAVHFVDSYTPLLEAGRKADGIHPNDAGYDVIARLWRDAILGQ